MIAITGSTGFIGQHLTNYLTLVEKKEVITINRSSFNDLDELNNIISNCSVVIHCAGLNRHESEEFIYKENRRIISILIQAIQNLHHYPKFINISSIHEGSKTAFGLAKLDNRKDLENLYSENLNLFINLKVPNVFGPFCKPNYNSFIATFSHNLINNIEINIDNDKNLDLLYIDDLIQTIVKCSESHKKELIEFNTTSRSVSEVLNTLRQIHLKYFLQSEMPNLTDRFELNLFNTYRSYIDYSGFFPKNRIKHEDYRGHFAELIRLNSGGQVSISTSKPEIERGNHFHTRKIERFQILRGSALIQLRKVNDHNVIEVKLDSKYLDFIDIPIWYTHNIINISKKNEEHLMLFWINEHYDSNSHDTYFMNVRNEN